MRIRFAFYKYNKKPLNFIISLWTWLFNIGTPWYSHVEIGIEIAGKWEYFSSTLRGGAKGTRWIAEKYLFKHLRRWDVYEIEVKEIDDIMTRINEILGSGYDFLGIFGFVTPFGLLNIRRRWYCSESIYYVLGGVWKRRISPRRFFSYISKTYKGLKKVSLDKALF